LNSVALINSSSLNLDKTISVTDPNLIEMAEELDAKAIDKGFNKYASKKFIL